MYMNLDMICKYNIFTLLLFNTIYAFIRRFNRSLFTINESKSRDKNLNLLNDSFARNSKQASITTLQEDNEGKY